ncbi:MAG: hypothetical protein KA314_23970 [Chloroflexi bacterium]|nr:hypothetical protein [Chloroflexota bacterium]MBP8058901.1 hypothetical protein [Chloroflexota bacterium]
MHQTRTHKLAAGKYHLAFLLLAFTLLGLAYSVVNPLYEATDELRHYRFVRYLVENRHLPVQGEEACRSQSHHPPLFYILGAIATIWVQPDHEFCYLPPVNAFWAYRYGEVGVDNKTQYLHSAAEQFPWQGDALAAHIVRGINVLIGAVVVWLTWATGRVLWPKQVWLATGAAAFVAFNPMFLYMAGAINNDIIAACSGAAITYSGVRLLHEPGGLSRRWGVGLGLVFGFALMSKFNMAAAALLLEAVICWVAWQHKQWRLWWEVNLLLVGVTFLVAGWWFWRNYLVYGDPTGFKEVTELWGARDPRESLGVAWSEWSSVWSSLWGRFGFGQIPLPAVVYQVLWGLTLFAAAALGAEILGYGSKIRRHQIPSSPATPLLPAILYLCLTVALFASVVFAYMLVSPAGSMGRFFFPGLPALALLLFYGLVQGVSFVYGAGRRFITRTDGLTNRPSARLTVYGSLVTVFALLAFSLVALFGYLQPAYARPRTFSSTTPIPNPTNAQFDFFANLRGYELNTTTLHPGEPLDIDLYWEVTGQPPGNYLLFVHLQDSLGLMVTQRDTHPGLGNFPSREWRPGDRFIDTIRIYLPETAYVPETVTVSIGLYAPEGYRLGIADATGQGIGDSLTLGTLQLEPISQAVPNPQMHNFNNEIELYGYTYRGRELHPGDALTVTLYWQALQNNLPQYTVEVLLVDTEGRVHASANSRPQNGEAPTAHWQAQQQIIDTHTLVIPPDLALNSYQIHVSLLDESTGVRQNRVATDGHWISNHLLLAPLLINK